MTSRSKGSGPLLSAALAYAERGWLVFPLAPRDKHPLTKNGLLDASNVRTTVLQWWQLYPDANIGLRCGDPFDVLDLDSPDAVPNVLDLLGRDYRHDGPVVSTGKGWHFYFASDPQARNRAGLLGGKVDYRGSGGYVVAPPSVHPSGRLYRWAPDRDYQVGLPPLPEVLRAVVLKPPPAPPRPLVFQNLDMPDGIKQVMNAALRHATERPPIIATLEAMGRVVTPHGAYFKTNCIFHEDPGPSMVLYPADDSFRCYGCEAYGDSLNLSKGVDITGRKVMTW